MGINNIIAVNRNPSLPVILTLSPDERKELKGRISLRINPMKGR